MSAVINFFRSRHLERIDYVDVILFFQEQHNCKIVTTNEDVQIYYRDESFNLTIPFLITKRSRVSNIADISAEYVNIRFLVEVPIVLPEQVSRNILTFVGEICKKFSLVVYHEGADDAFEFDILRLMKYLLHLRDEYMVANPDNLLYTLPRETLTHICNYYQILPNISEQVKEKVYTKNYQFISLPGEREAKLVIEWEIGVPQIFPPHLDYIKVTGSAEEFIVPAAVFYKVAMRQMYELKNYVPGAQILMLCGKGVRKVTKQLWRIRKGMVPLAYEVLNITEIIEK